MDYLLFQLYGPLASWGEIAVGESRHTAVYPSKSALLGLLAASLGIRRDEEQKQQALAEGYQFAVKVLSTGQLLRDYHTVQVPDSTGSVCYRTRRDELIIGRSRLGTILSSREYRCDAFSLVAVKPLEAVPYTLAKLAEHLREPRFHLYLGRKSCPLAVPLNPRIKTGNSFGRVLDEYSFGALYLSDSTMKEVEKELAGGITNSQLIENSQIVSNFSKEDKRWLSTGREPVRYYWEGDDADLKPQQVLTRHDQPLSRSRWQFVQRQENLYIKEKQ
ncbi:MAG: type I-E CRISPR-associated protein Cas5/CasD [Nitrospirota bacterium]